MGMWWTQARAQFWRECARHRGDGFSDALQVMRSWQGKAALRFANVSHTVLGVVAANARLTKEETNKVAQMVQDGLARTVRPAHTTYDGDTFFALATGRKRADVNLVGAYAAKVAAQAIVRAVQVDSTYAQGSS